MTTHIRRVDHVLTTAVADALLMLNVDRGLYHSINGTGTRIWELLAEPTTEAALVETLLGEFDVDRARCTEEVGSLLAMLRERGLLRDDA
jgi:hypothetical protein